MLVSFKFRLLLPEIDENSPIGLHIRRKRLERELSQGQVGKLIGVVDEAIMGWELGYYHPKIQYIPKIIAFLGYNPYAQMETKTFGGKIKVCRLLLGFSFRKMAKFLKADPATIARWESNHTTPLEPRLNELIIRLHQTGFMKVTSK